MHVCQDDARLVEDRVVETVTGTLQDNRTFIDRRLTATDEADVAREEGGAEYPQ